MKNWDGQIQCFKDNLEIIRKRPTKKAIHDFRVAIKKLRSYLRLRQELAGKDWENEFEPVKVLFKIMGKLRDFENSLSLFAKFQRNEKSQLPQYKKYIQVNIRLQRQRSKQAALDFNDNSLHILTIEIHKSFSGFTETEIINKIREQSEIILKKVEKLKNDLNKNVHDIRKLLKDFFYWFRMLPEEMGLMTTQLKKLEKVLDKMGLWQDYFVFQLKLKRYKKDYGVKGTNEYDSLQKLEEKIKEIQHDVFQQIIKRFEKLHTKQL